MTEAPVETPPEAPATPEAQPAPEAPPWGDDFDPARAWHTIQTLREAERERDRLRGQVVTPEQQQQLEEYQALVEASKSEAQRQQEALAAATREAETARADAIRYRAAATYGIPADHFDLLGAGTEQEITARAEKLAGLLGAQAAPQTPPPAGRPVEQLRPGATPAAAPSEDDLVYERLFGPQAR